MNNRVIT